MPSCSCSGCRRRSWKRQRLLHQVHWPRLDDRRRGCVMPSNEALVICEICGEKKQLNALCKSKSCLKRERVARANECARIERERGGLSPRMIDGFPFCSKECPALFTSKEENSIIRTYANKKTFCPLRDYPQRVMPMRKDDCDTVAKRRPTSYYDISFCTPLLQGLTLVSSDAEIKRAHERRKLRCIGLSIRDAPCSS